MPIYITVFLQSPYYGPTFSSSKRLLFNGLYRLGEIYSNSVLINYKYNLFISDEIDGIEKNISNYVQETAELGRLMGTEFKMFFYVK